MGIREDAKAVAAYTIDRFKSDSTIANNDRSWGISKDDLIKELIVRIHGVRWPNQGQTALCGPAAFVYWLVQDRPDMYVDHVIRLWKLESFQLGKMAVGVSPKVLESARNQFERHTPETSDISPVDWLFLASLRNQSADLNPFGDYETPADQWAAITLPSNLKTWFNAVGSNTLIDNTSLFGVLKPDWNGLERLSDLVPFNRVLLLVSASIFTGKSATTKNHWVVLNEPISVNGRPMSTLDPKRLDLGRATI